MELQEKFNRHIKVLEDTFKKALQSNCYDYDDYEELKEERDKYLSAKNDLQEELDELYEKYNELEISTKINFQFLIHKHDWKHFREGDHWLHGPEIDYSIHRYDIVEKYNVRVINGRISNLPVTFKHCVITFDDNEEFITFINFAQKNNIEFFTSEKFKYL